MEEQEGKFLIIDWNMRNLISSKKGQTVQSLPMVIMTLVFAAIILVMGLVITQSLQDTTNGGQTGTVAANETLTLTAASIVSPAITHATDCGYTGWTPTAVYNDTDGTNGTLAVTTDYTVNAAGTLTNVTYWETPLFVTYTYTWGGITCEKANLTVIGLGTFADFWEIIVLAIVITVVIGLLLAVFGGRRER